MSFLLPYSLESHAQQTARNAYRQIWTVIIHGQYCSTFSTGYCDVFCNILALDSRLNFAPFCFFRLFSLHIRSMWETICDAQAGFCTHSSNSKFVSKIPRLPPLSEQRAPPPPENWNLGRSWHFEFWLGRIPAPPPRKLKFKQILALWVFRECPPSGGLGIREIVCGD